MNDIHNVASTFSSNKRVKKKAQLSDRARRTNDREVNTDQGGLVFLCLSPLTEDTSAVP